MPDTSMDAAIHAPDKRGMPDAPAMQRGSALRDGLPADPASAAGDARPLPQQPRRFWVYGVGALSLAVAIAGYGVVDRSWSESRLVQLTANEAVPTVDVIHPVRGVAGEDVTLPGTVQAYFEAPIYARASGYLQMWYKDIGAHVATGEVLATIATPDLDQEFAQAKANLSAAEADYQLAHVTARRWQRLLKSDAVSVQDVDVKAGDAQAKQAAVTAAQANVARLQALEQFKRIVAPFDGVITARKTDVGALINAGSGVGPQLFTVADVHKMRVYVRVPQAESADITMGMKATLSLPQYPNRVFEATVTTTAHAVDPVSNTMLVELMAGNADGLLFPGTYADVHFDLPPQPDIVRVPTSVLLFRQGGLKVAVVGPADKAEIKPVQAGRDLGTEIEITSGLAPSDRVINSPPDSLVEGETVHLAAPRSAEAAQPLLKIADK